MDDGTVIATIRRLVAERRDEARALCPVDARLALEFLTSGGRRLRDELRAVGEPAAIRERLLDVAAGCVEQLADEGGWPLFDRDATLRAHAALRLAAAADDELRAAVFDAKPLALLDPAGSWEQFMRPLLDRAEEWTEEGSSAAQIGEQMAYELRSEPAFRAWIVEAELRANERLRTVVVTTEGPLLLAVTQRTGDRRVDRYRVHAAGAVVGGQERRLSGEEARLLSLAATALANDPRLYVDTPRGVAATRRRLRAAIAPAGARSWRPIGAPCPIGAAALRRLLADSSVYTPHDASPWQLAMCVGATRVSWLEGFPLGDFPRLVVLAWHDSDQPIAVAEHDTACTPAAVTTAPADAPEPDTEETARLRLQVVRDGQVEPETFVERLTAAQVAYLAGDALHVSAWLDDGSVLLGEFEANQEVLAPDGTLSKPTHVPLNGLALPRRSKNRPIL